MASVENPLSTRVSGPVERAVPEYPSAFFTDGRKPVLSVKYMKMELNTMREMVLSGIRTMTLNVELATTYLVKVLFPMTIVNREKWISFGLVLGEPGETIGMDKLVTIREVESEPGDLECDPDGGDEWLCLHDQWMCLYVVSIYRLIKITNDEHRAFVTRKINQQLRHYGGRCDIDGAYEAYFKWTFEIEYRKLIGVMDMFYHRFEIHEMAYLRYGTMESRYRDCAGLRTMQYMMDLFGLRNYEELHEWIFVSHVVDDFKRMAKSGEEIDNPFSYMPYIADLGIARKSPYSCTLNLAFHMWAHVTCALAGSVRSMHAHVIKDIKTYYLRTNSMVMACALRSRFGDKGEGRTGQVDEDPSRRGDPTEVDLPNSTDPRVWSKYLRSNENRVPDAVMKFCVGKVKEITEARQGTIGEWLQENITG